MPVLGRWRAGLWARTVLCLSLAAVLLLPLHTRRGPLPNLQDHDDDPTTSSMSAEISISTIDLDNFSRPLSVIDMRRVIERYNDQQTILNKDVFGPVEEDTLIIVVQVHKRLAYLRHLIHSLSVARHIDSVLLVFSHDFYDKEINELVQSVDFCKVMQIFYPHSIQTHPHEFPGESPDDCPRNIKKKQALERGCVNAQHPDSYGHYREAKFTQIKHHWWWKANRVFNQLRDTRYHQGLVLFLEEDHYVAEDFIHILRLMQSTSSFSCPRCNILSLGIYQKKFNYAQDSNKVDVAQWAGNKHNMGMAMNGSTWRHVSGCAHIFCSYDDYNWDWSLQYSAQRCLQQDLVAAVVRQTRVFHLGECGLHHNKKDCEPTAALSGVQRILKSAASHLYPSQVSMSQRVVRRKTLVKSNGGWGDERDHLLCINMTLVAS